MTDIKSRLRRQVLLGGALCTLLRSTGAQQTGSAEREVEVPRYDSDYPVIAYSRSAKRNRIWRLQQRLASGKQVLSWDPKGGYVRSLLAALEIEIDSQVVVFSKTSLQTDLISEQTPRAVYFNDDTYVGHIPGSRHVELTAVDAELGPVFYALENVRESGTVTRFGGTCLICHDTFGLSGGGVPRILAVSVPVEHSSDSRQIGENIEVDDRTPLEQRWGGWYVTGQHGAQTHLGNLPLRGKPSELLQSLPRANRASLRDYFDTSHYFTDTSDIVALMVLEHQKTVQNEITRASFKLRTALSRFGGGAGQAPARWADIGARNQLLLRKMLDPLIRALLMVGAAPLRDKLVSSSGFAERFAKLGPHDSKGRSLRELDLKTRLFRYPLSYLIYSEAFDQLPGFALDILRQELATSEKLATPEGQVALDILAETKPAFLKT